MCKSFQVLTFDFMNFSSKTNSSGLETRSIGENSSATVERTLTSTGGDSSDGVGLSEPAGKINENLRKTKHANNFNIENVTAKCCWLRLK